MGTSVNIVEVVDELRNTKKSDKMGAIFVDLSSAYNSVDRKILFEIIRKH